MDGKCIECGYEKCKTCGHEKSCKGCGSASLCAPGEIDIVAPAAARDRSVYFNVGTFTTAWNEYYFPIPVTIKPTTYFGSSQNNYSTIHVVSGNLPASGAGVDTPWEVIPAGKAFNLPCGHFWIRSDPGNNNSVNYRIFPQAINRVPWISHGYYKLPAVVVVGVASAQALAASPGRSFLSLDNQSNNTISLAFGPGPAVAGSGIVLVAGENVVLTMEDCPEDAVQAIASAAGSNVAVQEG
jgi:hypothetical protein